MAMAVESAAPSVSDGDLYDAGGAVLTDHHAEELLIGYLLYKTAAITETIEILQPKDLHDPFNRRAYELLIRAYETDDHHIAKLYDGLGGEKYAAPEIARLIAGADLSIDVAEVADHLQALSERRATGSADDVDYGRPFVSRFGALPWEDIGTSEESLYDWLVEYVVPLGEIAMAFGDSGTGKSFAMFDLGMCVARNLLYNGRNVEHGLVIYVAAEAGKGFAKRKRAYAIQHKLDPTERLPFVLLTKRPNFFYDDADAVSLIEEIKALKKRYTQRLVLIVIDTLSAITPGMDEISGRDQGIVRRRFKMLEEEFGATVIIVHHKPKNGAGPRGHGSITADIETTIDFQTIPGRKSSMGLPVHSATVRKQREGASEISWEFTLPVIEVGRNKWGNPETSCVVEPCGINGAKSAPVGFHATPNELLFMRALYDALLDSPLPPPAGLPKTVAHVTDFKNVRTRMRERIIPPHEDSEIADGRFRTAFSRAGAKLRDGGVIGVQGTLVWPTGKPVNGFSGPTA